jgi:lactoylglutathione lyase
MKFIFDHVHFVCRDVKGMAEYFERVFGAERIAYSENLKGAPNASLRLGNASILIRGLRPGEQADVRAPALVEGLDHFGLLVEDVEAAATELKARGARFSIDPQPTGMRGRMIAFVEGPERIRIELVAPIPQA